MKKEISNRSKTNPQTTNKFRAKKNGKVKRFSGRLFSAIFALLMIISLTSFIVVGYVANYIISYTNSDAKIDLKEEQLNQNQTSIIYALDNNGKEVEIARLHGEENRVWVSLDKMSEYLPSAFIALEDKRFEDHHGVDWIRFFSVFTKYNLSQGGSTITQQLIKNLTGEMDVTAVRKFKEIVTALNLEKNYSKNTILEAYLNTLALGNGCYGVQTAAETYFGKEVNKLNLAECAAIAAITKAPTTYNPLINPDKNKERQEECLEKMLTQGEINKEEYNKAIDYKLIFTNSPEYVHKETDDKKVEEKTVIQSFYVDYVIDSVISDLKEKYGLTVQQANKKIYGGGLKIYAAVDIDVQKDMEDVYVNRVTFPKQKDTEDNPAVQSAMTIMDYKGRIVGIVGQAGKKKTNRGLNRAADSPRQPGSSIKPLASYAPAIELGELNWSSQILDYGFPYNGIRLWPRNVNNTYGSGDNVTVQYAIQESLNTVAARVVVDILTPAKSMEFLQNKFHVSTLDPIKDNAAAPMAVGAFTNGITTLEMAAAYASFGNGGKYYKPYCYYKVTNRTGDEILLEPDRTGEEIISPATSDVMCELLQTVKTTDFGKGTNVRKFQIMAKTGTTTDDKDRWICGGTPYFVASVWFGYDKPKDIGLYPNPAGKVFIEVFNRIHEGLKTKAFIKSGLTVEKRYCTVSGKIAGDNCLSTSVGWYKADEIPGICTTCSEQAVETTQGNNTGTSQNDDQTNSTTETTNFFDDILDRLIPGN